MKHTALIARKAHMRGFSLIEVVVATAIFLIITLIVLTSQSQFRSNVILGNLAYDVALSVREAQVYGLGAREGSIGSEDFDIAYGVHFDSADLNHYVLFADLDRDGTYDESDELVELYTFNQGFFIASFCGELSGGAQRCGPNELSFLDIVFDRPEPDAIFTSDFSSDTYGLAEINLQAAQGGTRTVTITQTGQIAVEQATQQ